MPRRRVRGEFVCLHPLCCTASRGECAREAECREAAVHRGSRQSRAELDRETRLIHCSFSASKGTARICPESFFRRISTRRSACSSFVWQNRDNLIPSSNN